MNVLSKWDEPEPVKLTIDDFLLLDDAGAFVERGKIELIEGVIVEMNAQHMPHARAKGIVFRRLAERVEALLPDHETLVESAVAIPPSNAPEPDILVKRSSALEGFAPISSIRLVVEIADTTAAFDLGRKARIYATAEVPEYWVFDLKAGVVRQLWAPESDGYREKRDIALGESLEAVTIEGLAIETRGV